MSEPATNHLLDVARAWFDAGFAVIPSHEDGGKRPFGRWKSYQQQRPTWDEVAGWLGTGKYTGIGVLTGTASGNVELIELEGPMDAAAANLGRVIAKADEYASGIPELLATVARGCVEGSPGGGLHLLIRVTDGPAKGNTKLARTADGKVISETRGEGGFVVVAPTPGRNGHAPGTAYMFINGGHPSRVVEVTSEDRDVLHQLFTYALDESPLEAAPAPATSATLQQSGDSTFDRYRNEVTWAQILTPAGWTWSHRDGERDYWTRPGKSKADGISASTIEDGPLYNFSGNAGLPDEQGMSKAQVYAHLHHGGDLSAAAKDLQAQGYGIPMVRVELPPWEAQIDPDATDDERAQAATSWVAENLPRVDWAALWQVEHEEEWIVEPLLAARRLVALYSAPKVGKSLLMLEVAAAVAAGRPLFGHQPKQPRRTLYVDFENDPRADIRERLTAMGYGPDDLDNLVLLSFPVLGKLDTDRGSQELMAAIDHYQTEIVVVDTVSRAIAGEENENDTWLNFYKHTGLKLKQAGVSLIRLDHSGKDETKGQRGGSAKSGDVDAVWRMSRSGDDLFDLVCEAQRFPIHETSLTLRRIEEPTLRHEVLPNPVRAKRDELLAALGAAGVSKDRDLSLNAVKAQARDLGVKFPNKGGIFTAELLEQYRVQPPSWTTSELPEGGS